MGKLFAYLRWAFWTVVYLLRPAPKTFDGRIKRTLRCWSPWWKFKPHVYHNRDGKMWSISLAEDRCWVERRRLPVEVCYSVETGRIVGLKVFDEFLTSEAREGFSQWSNSIEELKRGG